MGRDETNQFIRASSVVACVLLLGACAGYYASPPGSYGAAGSQDRGSVERGSSDRMPPVPVEKPGAGPTASAEDETESALWPRTGTAVVERGDTLYGISRRYGVSLEEMIRLNGLEPPYRLASGQRLVLPRPHTHVVRAGDTVFGISRRYDVAMQALILVNGISPPYRIAIGQTLKVPTLQSAPDAEIMVAGLPSTASQAKMPAPGTIPVVARHDRKIPDPRPRSDRSFIWPVRGPILIGFGDRGKGLFNDGINIAAKRGTPVRAAENGVVVYSGNELRGFGNLILLKHADGWSTAYAHNSALLARIGDRVRRGQVIARVGNTGSVARPQLHFELRRRQAAVDPEQHLSTRMVGSERVNRVFARADQQDPG